MHSLTLCVLTLALCRSWAPPPERLSGGNAVVAELLRALYCCRELLCHVALPCNWGLLQVGKVMLKSPWPGLPEVMDYRQADRLAADSSMGQQKLDSQQRIMLS